MKILKILFILFSVLIDSGAYATKCDVDLNLKSFKTNPKAFMNAATPKRDANCGMNVFSAFDKDSELVKTKEYITVKDNLRKTYCHTDASSGQKFCLGDLNPGEDVKEGRAPISSVDRPENLVSGPVIIKNPYLMAEQGLTVGESALKPWSDWYWPIYVGQISYRYTDTDMQTAWRRTGRHSEEMWSFMIDWHAKSENSPLLTDMNLLSPAEKYDILVGDEKFTLTNFMLINPKFYAKNGKVASWMGICHGWAPASYMLARPARQIKVMAADGETEVTFRPSDIKALASQLWASGSSRSKFIGGRCNIEDPKTDPETGRLLSEDCFDNNPGSWHMAVVNQLGVNKKSFVMDATYDFEVWNQPVTSYTYIYFNPETMEQYKNIDDALVSLANFRSDKFKKYRSKDAVAIVGVLMEVEYLVETMPSTYIQDTPDFDAHNITYYTYDLELNAANEIIGGEWYTNNHPDFLWTPYDGSHAISKVDSYIRQEVTVENIATVPSLTKLAEHASAAGQPIGKVVEALVNASSNYVELPASSEDIEDDVIIEDEEDDWDEWADEDV